MTKQQLAEAQQHQLPAAPSESGAIINMIERFATDPNVDVTKLEKMMDMQQRVLDRQAKEAYSAAMARSQSRMGRVQADSTNPQTRSKYASYAALDKALRPIYSDHGFALSFGTEDSTKDEHIRVTCEVSHISGHSRLFHVDMPADGKGAKGGDVMTKTHAAGSAMSYGMRYLLKMIFNVAVGEDDDDGNGAGNPRITENQAADIRAMIEEVKANESAFLKYLMAKSIEDIPASQFDHAIKALEKKRQP